MSTQRILVFQLSIVLLATALPVRNVSAQQRDEDAPTLEESRTGESQDLVREILKLREKAAQLEAHAKKLGWIGAGGHGMKDTATMGKMDAEPDAKPDMGSMGGMGKMGMKKGMSKMGGMKSMGANGSAPMQAKPPEQPAAVLADSSSDASLPSVPHALHVGATAFFLDHAERLKLTPKQAEQLAQIRQASFLARSIHDLGIAQAEQQLWSLTGGGRPSIDAIRQQAELIAGLGAKRRVEFVQAVMEAFAVLTSEQHQILLDEDLTAAYANPGQEAK